MATVLVLLILFLLVVGSLILVEACRREQPLFKPLTRPKGKGRRVSPSFEMRENTDRYHPNLPRIGGHRCVGRRCFVTGMSRTECDCAKCQKEGR